MNNVDLKPGVPRISMLSEDQTKKLYDGALEVLEKQGSIVDHDESRELLLQAGAIVSEDGKYIRIPRQLVERAVETVPKSIKLYSRDGDQVMMDMSIPKAYLTTACDAMDVIDPYTGERRSMVSDDWCMISKIVDYLPSMRSMVINACANDIASEEAYRKMTYEVIKHTRVPLCLGIGDVRAMEEALGVAEIVAGGPEKFKEKPNMFILATATTPLVHHGETLKMLLLAAEKSVPFLYCGMQMQGVTTPVTSAGTAVIAIAETLAGMVIHQLKNPGAPFIFGGIPGSMDMKSTIFSYGCPETVRNTMAINEVAKYLNIPMLGTATTDAKTHDAQCAVEYTLGIFAGMLGGHHLLHDIGLLDQASAISPHVLVLCEEIFNMCDAILEGVAVDDETIALDVIEDVGPSGNFLMHKHSLSGFKNLWKPTVFDRSSDYKKTVPFDERIQNEVIRILENHEVPPLSDEILKALDEHEKQWTEKLKGDAK